jgi:hypothetical protein
MTQPCLSECEAPSTCKKKIKGIKKEEQRNEKKCIMGLGNSGTFVLEILYQFQ